MKPLALVLLAVLAFSFVPLIAVQQASALSAITFTNVTTITSQHEQFQQVWENGTSSSVYLDANSSGFYFADSWDGSTLTSDSAQLSNTTYTVDSHAYISPVDLSRYSINFTPADQEYAQAANNTVYDVGTEDFWMAGMFKTTSDSGGLETLIMKKSPGGAGYTLIIGSDDKLQLTFRDADDSNDVNLIVNNVITTNIWYAFAITLDRDGDATVYLHDLSTDTLFSNNISITNRDASLSNSNTFTIGRRSEVNDRFFSGYMDNLIPPQIGETLTEAEFLEFATTGKIQGKTINNMYDFNDGIGTVATDIIGSNDLTLFNSPTWSSDVAAASTSRPTIYVVGRDSDNSANGYGKVNLADLSEVDDEYFSSDLAPLDIAQSTSNLYSTAINGTAYGTLFDVSLTRSFGSYTETSIYTGTSGTPAVGWLMDVTTGTAQKQLAQVAGSVEAVAELAGTNSVLIGKTLDTITLRLLREGTPPGTFTVGVLDSSNNVTLECATETAASFLTLSFADYTFACPRSYVIEEGDRIGIKYDAVGSDNSNNINIQYSSTQVFDGTESRGQEFDNGAWSDGLTGGTAADIRMKIATYNAQIVVYDDSTPIRYHFFESGTDTIRAIKRTGSTTLLPTAMDHTAGSDFSVIQLTDRIIIQTATDTYQLLTATDAISLLHPNSFLSRPLQTFSISPAEREFNTNPSYLANASYAANIVPSTGATSRTGVFIQNVTTGGSGVLSPFEPDRYYYATENDLAIYAEDGSNTWTIASLGTKEQVSVTAYTEEVGIDLIENTTEILAADVIELSCDNGNYAIEMQYFAVGSDADCNNWWTFDQSGAVSPRQVPYNETGEVVHADETDAYTVRLSVATPDIYFLRTIYDGELVDSGGFDSGGNRAQELLLDQCYTMQIEESSTGNTVQMGNICAGDINPITVNLGSIVLPSNWLGATWSYTIQRDFDNSTNPNANSTNNHILFTFQKQQVPYSANVHVVDHPDIQHVTYNQWFNFTEITGTSVVNITGINSNQTLYFVVYDADTDAPVINAVSSGQGFNLGDDLGLNRLGLLAGIGVAVIFPVLIANLFPKSLAYFGIIVVGAVIGIMQFFGFFDDIPMNEMFWPVAFAIIALGVAMGYKRS